MTGESSVSSAETATARVLLIGFGNEGRCDDGLGPRMAAAVAELDCPGVTVESAYQLNIEDAAAVADHDIVVFADATVSGIEPFEFSTVEPNGSPAEFTTHSVSPAGVLGLAHSVFAGTTIGYTLAIRGHRFHEFGEELSEAARANLDAAVVFFRSAVAPGGRLRQTSRPLPEGGRT